MTEKTPNLSLLPIDIVGMLQRQATDLARFLDQPPPNLDPEQVRAHVKRMLDFADHLCAIPREKQKAS